MKAVMLSPRPLIIPDSGITLPRRPIVLPDIAEQWQALVTPAVRIGRLGKGIEARFAHRYIEAWTVAVVTLPLSDNVPLAEGMDSTLTLGTWLPLESRTSTLTVNGVAVRDFVPDFAAAIEKLSHTMTLKTGDIILPGPVAVIPMPERRITIEADGLDSPILDTRIIH